MHCYERSGSETQLSINEPRTQAAEILSFNAKISNFGWHFKQMMDTQLVIC